MDGQPLPGHWDRHPGGGHHHVAKSDLPRQECHAHAPGDDGSNSLGWVKLT